jgi:maleylacetoacetate isomerase
MMRRMRDLVLYTYWRSSSAFRVRIALGAKKLPHRSVAVNLLHDENLGAEHIARSPLGHVPCLVVDGVPFVESVAIVELLEELYPDPPFFPADPFARARVRALVELVNSGIQPLQNLDVLRHLSEDVAVRTTWSRHFVVRGLTAFEAQMKANEAAGVKGAFAYGDTLTAVDAFLVPMIYNARRFEVDLTPFPRILRATDAALQHEAVIAALPENQADAVVPKV